MTVGIAAITEDENYIVVASDRMLSSGGIIQAADDATLKMCSIGKAWGVTFAAQDANLFNPIVERAIELNPDLREHQNVSVVSSALSQAYREQFETLFTSQRLSRFGYTSIADFRAGGRRDLGDDVFARMMAEIDEFDLGISFLGYGFDGLGRPRIFEVANPGTVRDRNLTGYAAIGSGIYMATASLRRRSPGETLESTMYRVLEAKFCSETATGVGRSTSLLIVDKEGMTCFPQDKFIDIVREEWIKTTKQPDPKGAIDAISKLDVPAFLKNKKAKAATKDEPKTNKKQSP